MRRSPRSTPRRSLSESAVKKILSIKLKSSEKGSIKSLSQGRSAPKRKMAEEKVEDYFMPENDEDQKVFLDMVHKDPVFVN